MKIILGSASPRRREILKNFFPDMILFSPEADETALQGESPAEYALRISAEKARITCEAVCECAPSLIIACDTIVTLDEIILGKPENRCHAKNMLTGLCGRTHEVITSLTMIIRSEVFDNRLYSGLERTKVTFKPLQEREIDYYLNITDYSDKAGSYAFQQNPSIIIEKFTGSATNIIGFPLSLFFRMTAETGIEKIIFFQR